MEITIYVFSYKKIVLKGLTFFGCNDIVNSYEKIRQKNTNKNFKYNINNNMDDNYIQFFRANRN